MQENSDPHRQRNVAKGEGWGAIASEVAGADDAYGVFSVLGRMARRPIDTAIALAEDPNYRGHLKFFTTCLAAWIAFGLVVLPGFAAWYSGSDASSGDARVIALGLTILQYLEIAVTVPLGFYLYRLGAQIARTPRNYFKFALLGTGFALLLSIAMQSLRVAGIVAIRAALPGDAGLELVNAPWLIVLVNFLMFAVLAGFGIAMNKSYWGLKFRFLIPIALVIILVDVAVVTLAANALQTPEALSLLERFS
ncbi:MAG: hypothetical protein ACT4OU_09585 [Hyphomicrobium sp.]